MPKTHKNLYTQLLSFEAMYAAFIKAKRGKRYRQYVLKFESDLEANLLEIIADLEVGTYKTSGYSEFYVFEPKRRTVAKLVNFRDRVVQHAICAVIEPIFERLFIHDSYACRKGKGTHAGADRAEQMMRKVRREHEAVFALKCDIRKYFDSIDHGILKRILSEKIGDARMMPLLSVIIDSYGIDGKGLPLGNLTSQLFANIYLNKLDDYVKSELKERLYVRYMDDFVIFHHDKTHLSFLKNNIESWLSENLVLCLNGKTAIFPIASKHGRALDFLGYRILPNSRKLRRNSIARLRKKISVLHEKYSAGTIDFKSVRLAMASNIAHASKANSNGILSKLLSKPFVRSAV